MEQHNSKTTLPLLLLVGLLIYVVLGSLSGYSFLQGPNNRNVSVDTTVNITNSLPEVLSVIIEGGATNITLNAGSTRFLTCNSTIRDWNGGSTITNVSAVFYHNASAGPATADDMNYHYTNTTCTLLSFDTYTRNVSCGFPVQYFANAGYWICNVTAHDPYQFYNDTVVNYSATSNYNRTHIDGLLALNVTPLIDYGNLSVGDTSTPQVANVTNLGNQNMNVSVRGFSNTSYLPNGLGFVCDFGNITVTNEKYNLIGGSNPAQYTNLTNSSQQILGLTMLQQQNDTLQVVNSTYWILYVPPNPFGRCNGTIVFQAERSA